MIQIKTSANSFQIGGLLCQKGKVVFNVVDDGIIYQNNRYKFNQVECDGAVMASQADLVTWLNANVFKDGGGSGDGAVKTVTGNLVTGTAIDPIVSINGTNRDIVTFDDDGNPVSQPIAIQQLTDISGFPSFQNGVFTATAMNAASRTGILSFVEFSTTSPKAGTFATYTTGGRMSVNNAIANNEAVNLGQLVGRAYNIVNVVAGRTFALADAGLLNMLVCYGMVGSFTIPPSSSVNFPIGSVINMSIAASTVTLVAGAGVDIQSDAVDFMYATKRTIRIIKISADRWLAS